MKQTGMLVALLRGVNFWIYAYATPRWPALGVKFKISDEHPRLFHIEVPPGLFRTQNGLDCT